VPFNFESIRPDEVFREFLQAVRREGSLVRVITAPDPVSAGVAGLIARLLKSIELDFELSTSIKALPKIGDERVIGINIPVKGCAECILIEEGSSNSFFKAGSNKILRYALIQKGVHDLVSEFGIVTKRVKSLLAATLITKYIPRLRRGEVKGLELDYLRELCREGVLKEVKTPPIIGWGILPDTEAVKLSIDALIPEFFMSSDLRSISLDDISRGLGIPKGELMWRNFRIETDLGIDEIYLAGYTALYLMDTLGFEGLSSSYINTRFWRWGVYWVGLHRKLLKSLIGSIRSGDAEVTNQYLVVKADPSKTSATLIQKVLEGVFKDLKYKGVVLEWGGNYYIPQGLIRSERINVGEGLKSGLWRGYLRTKDLGMSA